MEISFPQHPKHNRKVIRIKNSFRVPTLLRKTYPKNIPQKKNKFYGAGFYMHTEGKKGHNLYDSLYPKHIHGHEPQRNQIIDSMFFHPPKTNRTNV